MDGKGEVEGHAAVSISFSSIVSLLSGTYSAQSLNFQLLLSMIKGGGVRRKGERGGAGSSKQLVSFASLSLGCRKGPP